VRTPEPAPRRETGAESIAEIILGPVKPRTPEVLVWAAVATVSLHGVAGVLAWRVWQESASRAPPVASPKQAIRVEHVVDLRPPVLPEPPPPVSPPTPPPSRQQPPRAARVDTPPSRAKSTHAPPSPEPARAGEVVAVKEAEAPLDFTGFDIVSGQAPGYAGGVTASTGSSARAVEAVAGTGDDATGAVASRARPIRLPARNWDCPWPREADTLRINEQTVVLRVVVTPEGRVTSADLVSDPGHGFGQAALACARSARFDAALDRDGHPYLATSPPIRVRFKRR
jgi:periplasmic protein TonB